jgi:putative transposase
LALALEDYSGMPQIRHIYGSPYRQQTNGKLERSRETLKAHVNLLVLTNPGALWAAKVGFNEFYNQQRHHEGIGNVTPEDVYCGQRKVILTRRKEQKKVTLQRRFLYNLGQAHNSTRGELGANSSFEGTQKGLKGPENA